MNRHASAALLCVAIASSGCAPAKKVVKGPPPPDPVVQQHDRLLVRLREHRDEELKANARFSAAAAAYEHAKDEYQQKLTEAMASKKASGRQKKVLEKNRSALAQMIEDRDRVGQDLQKAFDTLILARKTRNATALGLRELDGELLQVEDREGGGHAAVQQRAAGELAAVRQAAQAADDAQKAFGDAQAAVIAKEVEASQAIGTDVAKRDQADQELDQLRDKLEAAATSYVAAGAALEAAEDAYHGKVIGALPAGAAHDRAKAALDKRVAATKQLDEARATVKAATIDRAAQTKQRIAFDSEIDRVVEAGLTAKVKRAVLDGLTPETDAITKWRTEMQTEENAALALQRKIADAESELAKVDY